MQAGRDTVAGHGLDARVARRQQRLRHLQQRHRQAPAHHLLERPQPGLAPRHQHQWVLDEGAGEAHALGPRCRLGQAERQIDLAAAQRRQGRRGRHQPPWPSLQAELLQRRGQHVHRQALRRPVRPGGRERRLAVHHGDAERRQPGEQGALGGVELGVGRAGHGRDRRPAVHRRLCEARPQRLHRLRQRRQPARARQGGRQVQLAGAQHHAARDAQVAQAQPVQRLDDRRRGLDEEVGPTLEQGPQAGFDVRHGHARRQREHPVHRGLAGIAGRHRHPPPGQVGCQRHVGVARAQHQHLLDLRVGRAEAQHGLAIGRARHRAGQVDAAGAQVGQQFVQALVAHRLDAAAGGLRGGMQQVEVGAARPAAGRPELERRVAGQHAVAPDGPGGGRCGRGVGRRRGAQGRRGQQQQADASSPVPSQPPLRIACAPGRDPTPILATMPP